MGIISRETILGLMKEGELFGGPNIHSLDADLQSAKSFSLSARFRMQHDRYLEKRVKNLLSPPKGIWDLGHDLIAKGLFEGEEK